MARKTLTQREDYAAILRDVALNLGKTKTGKDYQRQYGITAAEVWYAKSVLKKAGVRIEAPRGKQGVATVRSVVADLRTSHPELFQRNVPVREASGF